MIDQKNMKIMKVISAIIIVNIFSFGSSLAQKDKKAEQILERFSENTKQYEPFKAHFTFEHIDREGNINNSFSGKIYIEGNKYKLTMPGSEIYSNGDTIWQYLVDVNEVTITKQTKSSSGNLLSNPHNLFTLYKENYKYEFIKSFHENGSEIAEIDLFPENIEKANYSRIRLHVDQQNHQLSDIIAFGQNGSKIKIKITDFKNNINTPDTLFTFELKKYPDIEINDLTK